MHSVTVASLLAAVATLATAAPSINRRAAYYVCYNNGFRGDCSVDPCAITWCPDYKPYTYEPVTKIPTPKPEPVPVPVPAAKKWYVCGYNGFRGECTVDPCAITWCPDYKPYTYEPVKVSKRQADPTVCAPGTGYFQSCSNGFRGCCKSDACGSPTGWCLDHVEKRAPAPAPAPASDPTVCAAGTGYFQSCSNGFRGCCKVDACSASGWCADYKKGTYEPVPAPAPVPVEGVCAGTGYYQVCGSKFKGCCETDACTLGYCPN
jgi:hypothetical protein